MREKSDVLKGKTLLLHRRSHHCINANMMIFTLWLATYFELNHYLILTARHASAARKFSRAVHSADLDSAVAQGTTGQTAFNTSPISGGRHRVCGRWGRRHRVSLSPVCLADAMTRFITAPPADHYAVDSSSPVPTMAKYIKSPPGRVLTPCC